MRIFLLMIISLSLMAEIRFSIEVLSVKDKHEISDAFMEKVNETELPFTSYYSKGNYRVLLGDFESMEEAKKILPDVQTKVSKKAFITREIDVTEIDPQQKMVQAMVLAQAKVLKVPYKEIKMQTSKSIEIKAPQKDILEKKREGLKKRFFVPLLKRH